MPQSSENCECFFFFFVVSIFDISRREERESELPSFPSLFPFVKGPVVFSKKGDLAAAVEPVYDVNPIREKRERRKSREREEVEVEAERLKENETTLCLFSHARA